ncbi:cyclic-phosphate processing receiver domain-containing protein [Hymenobacter jeollabukensis]|uniref:cyclic-phosphate processing receiver domain-containing protein n=1 Tax=Hymenobacter jeollabukensis TaxID=2025313 RepID=UPI001484D167|nr:cyclic-phosphate processing receiver domain-containing protein [Hymenobacter jeollabukensis]
MRLYSGYDCAKWLVEQELLVERFNVHSANPVGAANIRGLLENYRRWREEHLKDNTSHM